MIHPVYGLTETSAPSHYTPAGKVAPVDSKTGAIAVGLPNLNTESLIVDDNLNPLPIGEIGEIAIKGPGVIPGYWEKPDETRKTFKEGTLYTGDMGFRDQKGWFYIVDRKKDLIISSAYKIWPKEVEDCLYEHLAVNECAVVGVPCEYRGERIKAFVSVKNGANVSEKELIEHCRKRISAYKVPRNVEFVPEIPKNLSGKILRRVLRDMDAKL